MKHKHAELIKQWADGADIEWKMPHQTTWDEIAVPTWNEDYQYRIKPEEKKPVVRWLWAINKGNGFELHPLFVEDEKIPFSAMRYGAIRLDWSRTEFTE